MLIGLVIFFGLSSLATVSIIAALALGARKALPQRELALQAHFNQTHSENLLAA